MATIKVSDLNPVGTQFFMDSETYLTDLTDQEVISVNGGLTPAITTALISTSLAASALSFVAWSIGRRRR